MSWEPEGNLMHDGPIRVVDPTIRNPYPVLRMDRDNEKKEELSRWLQLKRLEAEHDLRMERLNTERILVHQKAALSKLEAKKKRMSLEGVFSAVVEGMAKKKTGFAFRMAYYMTQADKVNAVNCMHLTYGDDWITKILFILKTDRPLQKDLDVSLTFSCALFDDTTILIYKRPVPTTPPEPEILWDEEDIVKSGLNWK